MISTSAFGAFKGTLFSSNFWLLATCDLRLPTWALSRGDTIIRNPWKEYNYGFARRRRLGVEPGIMRPLLVST